MIFQMILMWIN